MPSRGEWNQRVRELSVRHCKTGKELNATLAELITLSVKDMRTAIVARILAGFEQVRMETPVDTGRARAGWHISGEQPSGAVPPPSRRKPEQNGILPEYAAMIRKAVPDGTRLSEADVIYIVNNVEYIMMLEAGWSKQAPNGFIGNFMETLNNELKALAAKYGGRA